MNEGNFQRLVLETLGYLLWVHQPRSKKSEEKRDNLQVKIHLALNPIEEQSIPSKTENALGRKDDGN